MWRTGRWGSVVADIFVLRALEERQREQSAALTITPTDLGLEHSQSGWGDHYVGTAEHLIAAGLVNADQIPGTPGRNKFTCTFIDGVPIKRGANCRRDEHYLSVRRVGKHRFEVVKGVSDTVNKARAAAREEARRLKAKKDFDAQLREASSKASIHDFREFCLRHSRLEWALDGGDGLYLFRFSDGARKRIDSLTRQIEKIIFTAQVVRMPALVVDRPNLRLVRASETDS
jgi:hypothetical protein